MTSSVDTVGRLSRVRVPDQRATPDTPTDTNWRLYQLDTAVTVTTTVTTVAWTTFDCTDDVPEGSTHVLIEIEYSKAAGALSRIDFRQRAGTQAIFGAAVTGSVGATHTGGNQLMVPVLSTNLRRSFDYEVTGATFTNTLAVKILGYWR